MSIDEQRKKYYLPEEWYDKIVKILSEKWNDYNNYRLTFQKPLGKYEFGYNLTRLCPYTDRWLAVMTKLINEWILTVVDDMSVVWLYMPSFWKYNTSAFENILQCKYLMETNQCALFRVGEIEYEYSSYKKSLWKTWTTLSWQLSKRLWESQICFIPNNFPYFVGNSMAHWLVWYRWDEMSEIEARERFCDRLLSRWVDPAEIIMFENVVLDKSIPEIRHLQVYWSTDNRNKYLSV